MSQNYDDIFERGDNDLGEFFSFKAVGDRIAGTFVDLLQGIDGYDNEQYIVVIQREGKKNRIGIRKTHKVLVDRLRAVRFGQIIGFSFDEERPSPRGANTKIINLKQDPNMVDEAWIAQKLATDAKYGISPDASLMPNFEADTEAAAPAAPATPVQAAPSVASTEVTAAVVPSVPVAEEVATAASPVGSELFNTIKTLIVNKGILTDAATTEQVTAKIVEITELEFTAENGPAIINKIATAGF